MAEHDSGDRVIVGRPDGTGDPLRDKTELRSRLLAARRARTPGARAEAAAALAAHVLAWAAARPDGPAFAYLPVGSEPGSAALLDGLRAAGRAVLLPVVPGVPGPLDWAPYDGPGSLGPGPLGLREPTTARRGPAALAEAAFVLVPALAVDRGGHRLGRGGGFYDRTLDGARPGTPLIALLHDGELLAEVPAEPHDRAVTGVVMPTTGFVPTGNTTRI